MKQRLELARYAINGLVATAVHFCALSFNLEVLQIDSAGFANILAAMLGITVSFLGSRYFVFPGSQTCIAIQFAHFSGLYGLIAAIHGIVLFLWTDWGGWDYRLGFLVATTFQVAGSYLGNKFWVFKA